MNAPVYDEYKLWPVGLVTSPQLNCNILTILNICFAAAYHYNTPNMAAIGFSLWTTKKTQLKNIK